MKFGKYRGKKFDWIIDNDKSYCKWVIEQTSVNNFLHFKNFITQNALLYYKRSR